MADWDIDFKASESHLCMDPGVVLLTQRLSYDAEVQVGTTKGVYTGAMKGKLRSRLILDRRTSIYPKGVARSTYVIAPMFSILPRSIRYYPLRGGRTS